MRDVVWSVLEQGGRIEAQAVVKMVFVSNAWRDQLVSTGDILTYSVRLWRSIEDPLCCGAGPKALAKGLVLARESSLPSSGLW